MRAARCLRYGPPSSVVVEEVDDPVAAEGQVVVDVAAAAVNFPDVLVVADRYQITIPLPFTVGSEFAGTVRSVGAGVDGLAVGDRVMGSALFGAFAEQIAVAAASLQPVDPAVDLATAAASGVAHQTAYHALRSVARVQPGEWAVVLGAAGGVGLAAIELGAVLGARMLAAASSADKLALCLELGAEAGVDYGTEDLKVRIKEITGGGADVVVDPVGGPNAELALRALRLGRSLRHRRVRVGRDPEHPTQPGAAEGRDGDRVHHGGLRPQPGRGSSARPGRTGRAGPAPAGPPPTSRPSTPWTRWAGPCPIWPSAGPWARCWWTPPDERTAGPPRNAEHRRCHRDGLATLGRRTPPRRREVEHVPIDPTRSPGPSVHTGPPVKTVHDERRTHGRRRVPRGHHRRREGERPLLRTHRRR